MQQVKNAAKKAYRTVWGQIIFWLHRYALAEIVGTLTALLAAAVGYLMTGSRLTAAIAGSAGEVVGYYGVATYREVRRYYHKHRGQERNRRVLLTIFHTLRGMLVEFGPAEAIDSLFLRPAALYEMSRLIPVVWIGWLAGKLIADVVFFVVASLSYQVRRRWFAEDKDLSGG